MQGNCFSAGLQGQTGVYILHDVCRFHQSDDDLLVVADFIRREFPVLAFLEVFLRWLIAADVKIPSDLRDFSEILGFIDARLVFFSPDLSDNVIAIFRIGEASLIQLFTFH